MGKKNKGTAGNALPESTGSLPSNCWVRSNVSGRVSSSTRETSALVDRSKATEIGNKWIDFVIRIARRELRKDVYHQKLMGLRADKSKLESNLKRARSKKDMYLEGKVPYGDAQMDLIGGSPLKSFRQWPETLFQLLTSIPCFKPLVSLKCVDLVRVLILHCVNELSALLEVKNCSDAVNDQKYLSRLQLASNRHYLTLKKKNASKLRQLLTEPILKTVLAKTFKEEMAGEYKDNRSSSFASFFHSEFPTIENDIKLLLKECIEILFDFYVAEPPYLLDHATNVLSDVDDPSALRRVGCFSEDEQSDDAPQFLIVTPAVVRDGSENVPAGVVYIPDTCLMNFGNGGNGRELLNGEPKPVFRQPPSPSPPSPPSPPSFSLSPPLRHHHHRTDENVAIVDLSDVTAFGSGDGRDIVTGTNDLPTTSVELQNHGYDIPDNKDDVEIDVNKIDGESAAPMLDSYHTGRHKNDAMFDAMSINQ